MSKKEAIPDKNDTSKDFMLANYQLIHERYLYERDVGERRLNAFLTLASAIIGGLLLFVTSDKQSAILPIVLIVGLALLLILGLGTFDRVRVRTMDCLSWLAKANLAQKYFFEQDEQLRKYLQPYTIKEFSESWFQSLMLDGLVRTVAILNTFTAAALSIVIGSYLLNIHADKISLVAIVTGLISWLLHVASWRKGMKKS